MTSQHKIVYCWCWSSVFVLIIFNFSLLQLKVILPSQQKKKRMKKLLHPQKVEQKLRKTSKPRWNTDPSHLCILPAVVLFVQICPVVFTQVDLASKHAISCVYVKISEIYNDNKILSYINIGNRMYSTLSQIIYGPNFVSLPLEVLKNGRGNEVSL